MARLPLEFESLDTGNVGRTIDLDALYLNPKDRQAFEARWIDFLDSDEGNVRVLNRDDGIITYPHKSWIPVAKNNKPAVLFLFW